MFVKKFEADTIDEALKAVKLELGPDAIILKTITNKGLKGAFKKKKIEITAAISEKSFTKKANVDRVLSDDQKQDFYNHGAGKVKEAIDGYAKTPSQSNAGYGQMGLNKMVSQIAKGTADFADVAKSTKQVFKKGLDDFLSGDEDFEREDDALEEIVVKPKAVARDTRESRPRPQGAPQAEAPVTASAPAISREVRELVNELKQELRTQQNKISSLEQKLHDLNPSGLTRAQSEAQGIYQLRTSLKALEVDESILIDLIRKATYELSKDDLENADVVFEFALREMTQSVNTALPLFSKVQNMSQWSLS